MKSIIKQIEKLGWKSYNIDKSGADFYKQKGDWRIDMTIMWYEDNQMFHIYINYKGNEYEKMNIKKDDIIKTIKDLMESAKKDTLDSLFLLTN